MLRFYAVEKARATKQKGTSPSCSHDYLLFFTLTPRCGVVTKEKEWQGEVNIVKTESKLESLVITRGFSRVPTASKLQAGAILSRRLLAVTVLLLGGSCQKSAVF